MTHEERRRLIDAPITFRVIPAKTHAGTLIDRDVPANERRLKSVYNGDDSNYDGVSLDEYIKQLER